MALKPFKNEPLTDFSKPSNRKAMEQALVALKATLGREYPIVIGGEEIKTSQKLTSTNPSRPNEVVGVFQKADAALANKAIETAAAAHAGHKARNSLRIAISSGLTRSPRPPAPWRRRSPRVSAPRL